MALVTIIFRGTEPSAFAIGAYCQIVPSATVTGCSAAPQGHLLQSVHFNICVSSPATLLMREVQSTLGNAT